MRQPVKCFGKRSWEAKLLGIPLPTLREADNICRSLLVVEDILGSVRMLTIWKHRSGAI